MKFHVPFVTTVASLRDLSRLFRLPRWGAFRRGVSNASIFIELPLGNAPFQVEQVWQDRQDLKVFAQVADQNRINATCVRVVSLDFKGLASLFNAVLLKA